jgi:hypothetical protein
MYGLRHGALVEKQPYKGIKNKMSRLYEHQETGGPIRHVGMEPSTSRTIILNVPRITQFITPSAEFYNATYHIRINGRVINAVVIIHKTFSHNEMQVGLRENSLYL